MGKGDGRGRSGFYCVYRRVKLVERKSDSLELKVVFGAVNRVGNVRASNFTRAPGEHKKENHEITKILLNANLCF